MIIIETLCSININEKLHSVFVVKKGLLGISSTIELLKLESSDEFGLLFDIVHFETGACGLTIEEVQSLDSKEERKRCQEEKISKDNNSKYRIKHDLLFQSAKFTEHELSFL